MPIPRVRITVRRLMVIVAAVALALGMFRLCQLRQRYLEKAANHASFRAYVKLADAIAAERKLSLTKFLRNHVDA